VRHLTVDFLQPPVHSRPERLDFSRWQVRPGNLDDLQAAHRLSLPGEQWLLGSGGPESREQGSEHHCPRRNLKSEKD
jgi:hypothetical protein